ncbi:cyclophilin-like fold protein [Nitrospirota bacterium]
MRVIIRAGEVELGAEIHGTPCARAFLDALPLTLDFNVWGDEFYFEVPLEAGLDQTATSKVRVGDMGYWPPGRAVALFFGPTPMSQGDDPVPASDVNIIGRITGDARELRTAAGAGIITIERA